MQVGNIPLLELLSHREANHFNGRSLGIPSQAEALKFIQTYGPTAIFATRIQRLALFSQAQEGGRPAAWYLSWLKALCPHSRAGSEAAGKCLALRR